MTDEARAVAEVAKTTGEIVKATTRAGAYLADVFASVPHDLIGVLGGDWLHEKRQQNLAQLRANTARILEHVALERLTQPSPSVVIPLLQAAVDESRPELQAMWAALLANAMTDEGKRVRRDYFDAVRAMETVDAALLDIIARLPNPNANESTVSANMKFIEQERVRLGFSLDDFTIARAKITKLGCMAGGNPPDLTAFGRGLMAACKAP